MSLLSRVANHFYWFGRYVERAENTARLIIAYANLALDLPRSSRLEWYSLVETTGSDAAFHKAAHKPTELGVMRFLIEDRENPGSIVSSLRFARENLRSTRDRVPREVSESMNLLYGFVHDRSDTAIRRTAERYEVLRGVVDRCQLVRGYIGGTMTHGLGYQFIRTGRMLERADMTTRIMDVRLDDLLPAGAELPPAFDALQWMAVLRSLSAYQMYRRQSHGAVRARSVIDFLLLQEDFPRSVSYCLTKLRSGLSTLPRSELAVATVSALGGQVAGLRGAVLSSDAEALRAAIDELQRALNGVHGVIERTYFLPLTEPA